MLKPALIALTMMGCDLVQGYFIGVPQPVDQLIKYLDRGDARQRTAIATPRSLIG